MGLSTLNGHRVTSARATIPAWGRWYADVSVDGEVTLTGGVTLKIADITLVGAVLSGGPAKGRSHFRIVGGAGGWGLEIPEKSYTNDAGAKVSTVLGDAALAAGEDLDLSNITAADRVGPGFVRKSGPACRLLEQIRPGAWYVDEAGVTRLGKRATASFAGQATRGPVDFARGTVTLAAEAIATIVPGVVIDGLEAVDVLHELTPDGLRSTVWGKTGVTTSRRLAAFQALFDQLDPNRAFRGVTEYRVVSLEGERLNLEPVRVSTGMPDLRRVLARPGVPGCYGTAAIGSRVLVGFADSSPARPFVAAFEDAEGDGFQPAALHLLAGEMVAEEHVMTTEACALLIYNTLVALMAAAGGGPLVAAVLQPLLGAAVVAALTAQATPAPPGEVAQTAAAAALLAGFATGVTPSPTSVFFKASIDAIDAGPLAKTANVSGLFPSIGSKAVKTG